MIFKIRMLLVVFVIASVLLTGCGIFNTNNDATPEPGPDPEIIPTEVVVEPQPTFTPPEPTPELDIPTPTPEPDEEEEEEIPETGPELAQAGEAIYLDACAGCHMNDGSGVQGVYPQLNNNPFVTADDPGPVTRVVITGRGGMPTFHNILEVEEIAAVVSYIRSGWNNNADFVSVEEVTEVWEDTGMPGLEEEEDEEDD
jgi:cytochrome c6